MRILKLTAIELIEVSGDTRPFAYLCGVRRPDSPHIPFLHLIMFILDALCYLFTKKYSSNFQKFLKPYNHFDSPFSKSV